MSINLQLDIDALKSLLKSGDINQAQFNAGKVDLLRMHLGDRRDWESLGRSE